MAGFEGDWHPAGHGVSCTNLPSPNNLPWDRIVISQNKASLAITVVLLACMALALPARAAMIPNSIAVFAALDKVTGKVQPLEIKMGETTVFGALKVTARACYTNPPTEQPETASFIEVDELLLDGSARRIFTGWTFAESPGLHAVEHPTFDVWLTSCKSPAALEAPLGRRPAAPRF
jgi:hypothetical protein